MHETVLLNKLCIALFLTVVVLMIGGVGIPADMHYVYAHRDCDDCDAYKSNNGASTVNEIVIMEPAQSMKL